MNIASLTCGLLLFAASAALAANPDPYEPSRIREFTGAPTRVVWLQDTTDVPTVDAERPTLRLMGWDSEDGKGERAILDKPAAYLKPLFTADGSQVVFGDPLEKTVSMVNWDGSGLRVLLKEAALADVWKDPVSGTEWVYAQVQESRDGKSVPVIRRYQINDPKVSELVWDKMPIFNFTVSGDGRAASGGGDGGNSPQGYLTLPNGEFTQRAGGCWPSIAPDNSHRSWVFQGNHRAVHFYIPSGRGGAKAFGYTIKFDESPGLSLGGREEVHRIRWSNSTRFMVCSSPFSEWDYKGQVKVPKHVAEKIEIYIGKFSEDLKRLEEWRRVTSNDNGDYWADVWIKPGEGAQAIAMEVPKEAEQGDAGEKLDDSELVFTWETGAVGNQISDPVTGAIRQCSGQLRANARFGLNHVLDLSGGWFVPDDAAGLFLKAALKNQAWTFEGIVTPAQEARDEQVIFLFGQNLGTAQAALFQIGNRLGLRMGGKNWDLGTLRIGLPNHIVLSYGRDGLAGSIDGRRILAGGEAIPSLSDWKEAPLVFGAEPDGTRNWPGLLEGIRLFGRSMDIKEAKQRYRYQKDARKERQPVEPIIVEAKLLEKSAPAKPEEIAPYRRCLNVNLYEIAKVIKGEMPDKKIAVAQWSVLDGKVSSAYEAMKVGEVRKLVIEPWDKHPEQDSERKIEGEFFDDVTLFYDTSVPAAGGGEGATAQTVEWASAESGSWSDSRRWSTGQVPRPGDSVVLGDVPKGSREIATSLPVTIRSLKIDQQGAAANMLKLGAAFTLRGTERLLKMPASRAVVLDTAGNPLTLEAGTFRDLSFNGTIRLSGKGAVAGVTILDGGLDYTRSPQVKFTGAGRGAAAEAAMEVHAVQITHLGAGYTSEPSVVIAEPDLANGRIALATAKIDRKSGAIEAIVVIDPGAGYTAQPSIVLEGGGGSGAKAEAFLAVSEIHITSRGEGYTEPPEVEFEGGGGSGARGRAATQVTVIRGVAGTAEIALTNRGALEQAGGSIFLDWAASEKGSAKRQFANEGEWTMKGGALKFGSSTGMPALYGEGNVNRGTMRVLDRSWLGFASLLNTGELEIGKGAILGQVEFAQRDGILKNEGVVRVTGGTVEDPAVFGVNSQIVNRNREVHNGSTGGAKASWSIVGGNSPAAFRITGGQVRMFNHPGASLEIASGGALMLETSDAGARHRFERREAKLVNAGETKLGGDLYIRSNHGSFGGIDNSGKLTLDASARLVRLQNSVGQGGLYKAPDYTSLILNREGGALAGSGKFSYVDATGEENAGYMRIVNLGNLSVSGEKPGRWELENVNVYLGAVPPPDDGKKKEEAPLQGRGTVTLRVAGAAVDSFDLRGKDGGGQFVLAVGTGNTLNIVTPGGARGQGTHRIIHAMVVSGTFDVLQFNGTGNAPYTVRYQPDGVEVVFP
jgi:hypothetical protein